MVRIGNQETWQDAEGKSQPATKWLLELMRGGDDFHAARVFQIDNAALRKLFELSDDKRQRVSIKELLPNLQEFETRVSALRKLSSPSNDDRAILAFADRIQVLTLIMAVFRLPDYSSKESVLASLQQLRDLETQPIPFVVPPKEAGSQWMTWTYAVILSQTANQTGLESDPVSDNYVKLFVAYSSADPASFNQAVKDIQQSIDEQKLAACPWDFKTPRGWLEYGTPRLRDQYYFGDARAFGTTLATFVRSDGAQFLQTHINFFPAGAAKKELIINSWRQGQGWAPIPHDKIRTTSIKVAGQPAWQVDIDSPEGYLSEPQQTRSIGFSLGQQAWVITCSGPKVLMEKCRQELDQLVESLVIKSPDAVKKWFNLRHMEPVDFQAGTKIALAVIPDGDDVWTLRATYFTENQLDQQIKKLRDLLKSIRFKSVVDQVSKSRLPFEWDLPEGWTLQESEGRIAVVAAGQPSFLAFEIQRLKVEGTFSFAMLVNQWRSAFHLPELSQDKITSETTMNGKRRVDLIVVDLP
jgi:hypothetical protein